METEQPTPEEFVRDARTDTELDPDAQLELEGQRLEFRLRALRSRWNSILAVLPILIVVTAFGFLIFPSPAWGRDKFLFSGTFTVYGIGTAATLALVSRSRILAVEQELNLLNAKRRILKRRAGAPSSASQPSSYFDKLVDINITNLGAYYAMVKYHANNSFILTVGAGFVGFTLVGIGLVLGFRNTNDHAITYVATGSGILTQFISAVFFYLYNRTVSQLKDYHDSLLAVQDILLSFKMVGDMPAGPERGEVIIKMIESLIGHRKVRRDQTHTDSAETLRNAAAAK